MTSYQKAHQLCHDCQVQVPSMMSWSVWCHTHLDKILAHLDKPSHYWLAGAITSTAWISKFWVSLESSHSWLFNGICDITASHVCVFRFPDEHLKSSICKEIPCLKATERWAIIDYWIREYILLVFFKFHLLWLTHYHLQVAIPKVGLCASTALWL